MISTKAQQKSTIDQIKEELQLDAHYTKDENDWYDDVQSESDYVFESHFEFTLRRNLLIRWLKHIGSIPVNGTVMMFTLKN